MCTRPGPSPERSKSCSSTATRAASGSHRTPPRAPRHSAVSPTHGTRGRGGRDERRNGGCSVGSLTAHLLETGDHDRLGFHPRCPVCRRQRLFGSLISEPVIPRRLQAVLASGVLAFSAAAPGAAAAVPPDRTQVGVAAPGRPGGDTSIQLTGDGIDVTVLVP